MIKKQMYLLLALLGLAVAIGCSGQKGDMTKDPKYADIANNIFITKQKLYYYHYTQTKGGKSGYFLSAESSMPTAELKAEIPQSSHVKISKVLEVPQNEGGIQVMVQGDVISDGSTEALPYMAIYDDIKPALKIN